MSNWTQGTGCPTEFLKGIEALTREFNNKEIHNSRLTNQIEKLLNESKEKNKTIEKQRKHIEALKQKGNRYIEVNEKDRIIIYDTKENKFSWRTYWSNLPSNIIDDLCKNELINYYKHNVLKIYNKERMRVLKRNFNESDFYQLFGHGCQTINKCFSFHLLKNVKKVRGVIRNVANKHDIGLNRNIGSYTNCIAICKNGNKCKCNAYENIYDFDDNPSEYNYLYYIKNWSRIGICSRHAKSGTDDDKRSWLETYLYDKKKVHKQDYNEFSLEDRIKLFETDEENRYCGDFWIQ